MPLVAGSFIALRLLGNMKKIAKLFICSTLIAFVNNATAHPIHSQELTPAQKFELQQSNSFGADPAWLASKYPAAFDALESLFNENVQVLGLIRYYMRT